MKKCQAPTPYLIAHRGFSGSFPENTMASFEAAVTAGAEMLELDIQLSKDKKIFVFHDETLDRTTSGSGRPSALTLEELQQLDCGSWFGSQFSAEKIPTLAKVLQAFSLQIRINIEVKSEAYDAALSPLNITTQLVELLVALKVEKRVIVSSFEPEILKQVHSLNAAIALALLTETNLDQRQLDLLAEIKATSWN
ncbi:MAG: glycerophosphodiester phosphodiesterase family protein, partial [SAR324 cluster bacterium]|nr:glycerophosphodiester phosphodiesterase family protein [SAR324 cluster bacterium]